MFTTVGCRASLFQLRAAVPTWKGCTPVAVSVLRDGRKWERSPQGGSMIPRDHEIQREFQRLARW